MTPASPETAHKCVDAAEVVRLDRTEAYARASDCSLCKSLVDYVMQERWLRDLRQQRILKEKNRMRTIFVAHPVSGDVEGNLRRIDAICYEIRMEGKLPIFPSHTWRRYLGSSRAANDAAAGINEEYFKRGMVDEIWFYGDTMSDGMRKEALLAHRYGILLIGKSEATKAALDEMGFEQGVYTSEMRPQLAEDIDESRPRLGDVSREGPP